MMDRTLAAVTVTGVSKQFSDTLALDNINLSIGQGEFFGLLGPNGAGKSTLISILAGLTRPSSGHASILGHDVTNDFRQSRKSIGVVPQELVYDPFFSVRETLEFQAGYFGIGHEADDWIDELLTELGLLNKADTGMRNLSGGMKRRALIAQALVHKPPVVVLDEPTAGVDVELRQQLWRFIKRLHKQGHTIVLTTHYLDEAESLCDRIAILNQGKIIALEDKSKLLSRGVGRKLTVELDQPASDLPLTLKSKLRAQNDARLCFGLNRNSDSVIDVLDLLRASGVQIRDIAIEDDGLEEVFVALTTSRGQSS